MAWVDQDLITNINPLCAYHKWKLRDGSPNPNRDQVTGYICDLKDGPAAHRYNAAVKFFANKLLTALLKINMGQYPDVVALVPSSTEGKRSIGLCDVVQAVSQGLAKYHANLILEEQCLTRFKSVSKNATGGNRGMEKHLNSIRVDASCFQKNDRILLIDDVATTGNSIRACKALLKQAGAGDVIMLVLGQTEREDE